jgi:hypothetical protein
MLLGTYSNVFETPLTAFTTLFPLRYHSLITAPAYMVTYACLQPGCVRIPLLALSARIVNKDRGRLCRAGLCMRNWCITLPLLYGCSVVLTVSLIQEGLADMKRHRSDDEVSRLLYRQF